MEVSLSWILWSKVTKNSKSAETFVRSERLHHNRKVLFMSHDYSQEKKILPFTLLSFCLHLCFRLTRLVRARRSFGSKYTRNQILKNSVIKTFKENFLWLTSAMATWLWKPGLTLTALHAIIFQTVPDSNRWTLQVASSVCILQRILCQSWIYGEN